MNRNVESHFSQLPRVNVPRSILDRSHGHKTSMNSGDIIPILVDEILPGDSVRMRTSKVIRLQTLLAPIYDNCYLDLHFWFVPMRLCWSHFQQFCGENTESAWAPQTKYTIPKIKSPKGGFATGTLADYMGLPVGKEWSSGPRIPSALPFRAYALICDNFFRDQNLTNPLNIPLGDANQDGSNGDDYINDVANGGKPFRAAKFHDYFTSCLPDVQKGDPVGFPINFTPFSGELPVITGDVFPLSQLNTDGNYLGGLYTYLANVSDNPSYSADAVHLWPGSSGGVNGNISYNVGDSMNGAVLPANLRVVIPETSGVNTSITINDLRLAFSLQRFLERMALGGSRYVEILASVFGVTSPDARLHLPEYLGGNRIPIQIHQVTNTAQGEKDFLGDLGAMSVTHDVNDDFEKSFTEHGYLIGTAVIRSDKTYSQGLERFWSRNEFLDFYNPLMCGLGEMPVYKSEIYWDTDTQEDVFGFQESYADYKYKPSRVSGELRPGIPNSLASWHLADYYEEAPTLSDGWIREDKTNLDRCLAVTSDVAHQAFLDIYFHATYTRPMPMYNIPGLGSHF